MFKINSACLLNYLSPLKNLFCKTIWIHQRDIMLNQYIQTIGDQLRDQQWEFKHWYCYCFILSILWFLRTTICYPMIKSFWPYEERLKKFKHLIDKTINGCLFFFNDYEEIIKTCQGFFFLLTAIKNWRVCYTHAKKIVCIEHTS